jgi:hypothetical protein
MFLSPVTELHELIIETSTHAEITLKVFIIIVYSNLTEHCKNNSNRRFYCNNSQIFYFKVIFALSNICHRQIKNTNTLDAPAKISTLLSFLYETSDP